VPDSIPLSQPDITDAEISAVVAALRSQRLSIGPAVEEFESLVAARCDRRFAIGVNSGTSGLHLALLALDVGPGDEIITPAFSFVASANCALHVGATPVFVDCDPRTLNMRADEVARRITPRTRAVVGVEVFGNPSGMRELVNLCNRAGVHLLEDACEGLGGRLGQSPIGSFGHMGVFGFYPNKQITTGEGGMIVTDDPRLASICRSLRNQGRAGSDAPSNPGRRVAPQPLEPTAVPSPGLGSWLVHERLGYNFRLSELNAALGAAQMKRLDAILAARQRVAGFYARRLIGHPDLILPTVESDVFMSWFVYVVRLNDQFTSEDRDNIIEGLRRHDIGAANYFPPIHLLPFYRRLLATRPGQFPVTESVAQRTIALPFYSGLTERDVDIVCQTLDVMIGRQSFSRR
jgi:perosamine synthetase